jgi:EmrB/QacA subfamily drug resistance transporter
VAKVNDREEQRMTVESVTQAAVGDQDRRRWVALALIVVAQFMVVLDIAIVNVALPSIRTDLHFTQESLQWVITAYSILFGGVLLLGGRLSDLLGRRRLFMAGLALFTVSSLLDGLAWSEGSLIGFRALQGLGAALLSPAALSILTTTFREGRERNLALGIWGAASGSGGAAGVLVGGVLTSYLSWSWVFFINVPVGIAVIVATPMLLAESRGQEHSHFDVAGATSVTAAVMLLVYAMTRATQEGWGSVPTLSLLGASVALLAAFVVIELRSPSPLLPMRMFRNRMLSAANATAAAIGAIAFSEFFLLTLYMQQVLGYSAIQTGVGFAAVTVTIIVFSNVAQMLVTRFGVRSVLAAGLTLDATALAAFTQLPVGGHYFWNLFPAFLISGAGLALSFVPVTIASPMSMPTLPRFSTSRRADAAPPGGPDKFSPRGVMRRRACACTHPGYRANRAIRGCIDARRAVRSRDTPDRNPCASSCRTCLSIRPRHRR